MLSPLTFSARWHNRELGLLLLSQSKCSSRDVKGGCAVSDAELATVRRICTNGSVALAPASPEHVTEHSRTRPLARGRNGRNKVICCFLVGGAEWAYAVRNGIVPHCPKAPGQLRGSERRHSTVTLHMLLPATFE